MLMTSVSGHLLSLDFVLAYKNWYCLYYQSTGDNNSLISF